MCASFGQIRAKRAAGPGGQCPGGQCPGGQCPGGDPFTRILGTPSAPPQGARIVRTAPGSADADEEGTRGIARQCPGGQCPGGDPFTRILGTPSAPPQGARIVRTAPG